MQKTLVSIITVCWNSEKYIRDTIESVLNQTYKNIQYIIIDGKSTDKTLSIIDEYKERFGDRLTLVSEKDSGIYNAMNKGLALVKGELVGIINSDDYYELNAVEKMVEQYKLHGSGVYYGFERSLKDEKEYCIVRKNPDFLKETMIAHEATFISTDIYKKIGNFDENYRIVADYDLMLRIKEAEVIFFPVNAIISNFRFGGASSSRTVWLEMFKLKHKWKIVSTPVYLCYSFAIIEIRSTAPLKFSLPLTASSALYFARIASFKR